MKKNNQIKLDERWFEQLRNICSHTDEIELLQQYTHITQEEKDAFLHNETENPRLVFKKNIPNNAVSESIDSMLIDLNESEKDTIVLDLYQQKLMRRLLRDQLVKAAWQQNDVDFYKQSALLYGKPKKKYFVYIAHKVTLLANQRMVSHPVVAKRLKKIMSKIDVSQVKISADILPPPVSDGDVIVSADQAVCVFKAALDRLAITGWTVVVDTTGTRSRFSVAPLHQIIYIPSTEKLLQRSDKLTTVRLEGLAEHEVGVHVRRGFEGAHSKLMLLQIGLDSYLPGEEGLAAYSQQQIEGAEEFYGFDRYLAASLAVGMDGIKRDFRTVFAIMTDYYTLHLNTTSLSLAQNAAWEVCTRIFRGTTGKTPGTILTKDIVYFEGNIEMWHLISDRPAIFESLFIGKYNPLIPRHIKSLQTLEILT